MPANHLTSHTEETKAKISRAKKGKPALWKRRETKVIDGETHYRCGKCKHFMPSECFYKSTRSPFGIKYSCKKCHCQTSIATRNPDTARAANRRHMRLARERDPEKFARRARGQAAKLLDNSRVLARRKLNNAVRSGKIQKPSVCFKCGNEGRIEGHHADYSNPLEVQWLCSLCHGVEHQTFRPAEAPQ